MEQMLRPENWNKPTGESPVRVSTGTPGSRPQPESENVQAERGVKSLFIGGSKSVGCSLKRTLQPRQIYKERAEPLISRLVKRNGRNLRAGPVKQRTNDWFRDQGLHRLRGTVRYPGAA